jgi:hypothetical protein
MSNSTLLLVLIVASYIVFPGFYSNLGDIAVLGWKTLQLEVQRYILLVGMRRQLEKDRKELEAFLQDFSKRVNPTDDELQ